MTFNAGKEKSRGFTLIEVLVVLSIMGLFVGLASAIVRPDERGVLRVESERLAQLLELAAEESRLTGRPIAWTAGGSGYRFWRLGGDAGWSEVHDSDLLRARSLPQGMLITGLQIENMPVPDAVRLEFVPYAPALSFNIAMSFGAVHGAVTGSPIGEIQVMPAEGAPSGGLASQ